MLSGASLDPLAPTPSELRAVRRAQRIQNLAYALIKAGIQPGNTVAYIAPNMSVPYFPWFGGFPLIRTMQTRYSRSVHSPHPASGD